MSLDNYKLPLCLVDGVEFTLDDAPEVKVTVRMPIDANRKFAVGWAKRLPMKNGQFDASPFDVVEIQKTEFFESQIIKIVGVKKPESFWTDYPLALEEIWTKVRDALPNYQAQLETETKN